MLSAATMKFYRGLWAQLRKAKGLAEADRKPLHAQLGLPASSKDFTKEDFDTWKGHVFAETQPGNADAQLAQLQMPATRRLVFIGHLLTALEMTEMDAEALVVELRRVEGFMRWNRRKMGGRMTVLQTLPLPGLDVVRNKLKDRCRERWDTKEHLLGEIHTVRAHGDFDEAHACAAVMTALNIGHVPAIEGLGYEDLLIVLSALRALVPGAQPVTFLEEHHLAIDVPF